MIEKLESVLEDSFLQYSSYVIQRRAIPDARDMMKYTARQILHAQSREKLDAKHPFKKSLKSVSAATSFSYVHGGTSCYEQIIRMGRPLVQHYFLEEINGNYGTPTGSQTYSADRYTEARISPLAMQMFDHITKDTLNAADWEPTYDEEGVFPKVLPSLGYYNIVNGSFGSIAPTMISSIPQFNLKEVNDAIISLIREPGADISLLPDFASGGILLNPKTTLDSLARGEGKSALIRGHIKRTGTGYLEVVSLPYGVYTNTICTELEKALDKGGCPFTEFKDLSKRDVNVRIFSSNLEALEEWLYKNTSIQKHFTIKMIMLDNGKTPKLFGIKDALLAHIKHAKAIWRRALEYDLQQLKDRQEIIEGLLKAYSILDEIIALIKASAGRADAVAKLVNSFSFSARQAEAIVDLRLHRLSAIDIQALKDELESNLNQQADIQETLDVEQKFNLQLIAMYEEVARKFGDKRRTEIFGQDIFESAQDGNKATEEFKMEWDANGFTAVSGPTEKVYNMLVQPDDKLIIVTNQVRGFTRLGKDFTLGTFKWSDLIKLQPDEEVLFVIHADALDQFDQVQMKDEDGKLWSLHKSFVLLKSSQRGKKLTTGKQRMVQVHLE